MKYYTGIGSRKLPSYYKLLIKRISRKLNNLGFVLRSGGADGADLAFESQSSEKEIFLPYKKFNNNISQFHKIDQLYFELANNFYKDFYNETLEEQLFIARDVQQVINDLVPSDFIVYWSKYKFKDFSTKKFIRNRIGGTWYALKLGNELNIPIYNLHELKDRLSLKKELK